MTELTTTHRSTVANSHTVDKTLDDWVRRGWEIVAIVPVRDLEFPEWKTNYRIFFRGQFK